MSLWDEGPVEVIDRTLFWVYIGLLAGLLSLLIAC